MKIETYREFEIHESTGHGKNTKGNKKTSSIQVRQNMGNGYLLLHSVSYKINGGKRVEAISKCRKYIDENYN